MSLDTLAVVYRRPRPEVVTGFKVFRRYTRAVGSRTEAVLTFEYHHHFRLGRTTFGCQNRLPISQLFLVGNGGMGASHNQHGEGLADTTAIHFTGAEAVDAITSKLENLD